MDYDLGHFDPETRVLEPPENPLGPKSVTYVLGNGKPVGTRTPDLYRVNVTTLSFTITYKTAGTAKIRGSRARPPTLWVGLWVGNTHAIHRSTLRLTAIGLTSSEITGVGTNRGNSASCDETGRITFSFFVHLSFAFCHHSPLLVLRFYDGSPSRKNRMVGSVTRAMSGARQLVCRKVTLEKRNHF
jgi:hypothetical protein